MPALVEDLECRTLLSASYAATHRLHSDLVINPAATSAGVDGYTPSQIRKAYGFDQISFGSNGSVAADGRGQTIAIVDAFNDPNIAADLNTFDAQFGLPSADLKVVNQTGGTKLPATDAGWAGEIALDVEWAHAIAPAASIVLVEANSDTITDLMAGVDTARHMTGVSTVSMSWGGSEFFNWGGFGGESQTQLQYDKIFSTPAGHQGVTFIAAAGDSGQSNGVQWPASSPNVVAVGGTSLQTSDSSGTYAGEGPWRGFQDGTSGGFSQVESEPSWQQTAQQSGARSTPDVGYNADPNTGFAVYDSVPGAGRTGWDVVGGTSAGSPQWAALVAIANQGRALAGQGTLDGTSQTLPALYSVYSPPGTTGYAAFTAEYNDIGNDGYGYTTGLGTPHAAAVIQTLMGSAATIGGTTGGATGGTDGGGSTPQQPAQLPASPLAASFSTVPISGIGGQNGAIRLRLTNTTFSRFTGPVSITLYASTDGSVSADDAVVTTVTLPNLKLRPGGSKGTELKFVFPTGIADGNYELIADATATATNTAPAVAMTSAPVAIAAAHVDLATTFAGGGVIGVNPSGLTTAAVTIRNNGNVPAVGTLGLNLFASADGTLDFADTLVATLPIRKVRLRPGQSMTLRIPFSANRIADPAGTYDLIADPSPSLQLPDADPSNDVAVAQTV